MHKLHILAAGCCALALAGVASEARSAVILCGVVDQSPQDLDNAIGIVRTTCLVGGGTGAFDGTAQEFQAPNFDLIVMRGLLTGAGSITATNTYNQGPWVGNGGELAFVRGRSVNAAGGSISVTATASTFNNNSAFAFVNPVGAGGFADSNVRFGQFAGQGLLTAKIDWDAQGGTLNLLNTGDFQISVPEPQTWALMLLGFGALGAVLRRSRRAVVVA